MPDGGRSIALPRETEPSRVDAIVQAYVEEARGDAGAALRLAVADALATLAEFEQRTHRAERFVSRGFVRGAFGEVIMRHRQPRDSMLPPLARDQLVAELRRARDSVIAAQNELRRQAPLSRALDSLKIDIDDIAFLLTGNRDHFTRPMPYTKRPDPEYRKATHELTNLEGYAGLDKQLGMVPDREEE